VVLPSAAGAAMITAFIFQLLSDVRR
jgi:hypothetical protein